MHTTLGVLVHAHYTGVARALHTGTRNARALATALYFPLGRGSGPLAELPYLLGGASLLQGIKWGAWALPLHGRCKQC